MGELQNILKEDLKNKSNHLLIEFNKKIVSLYEDNKEKLLSLLDEYDKNCLEENLKDKTQFDIDNIHKAHELKILELLKVRDAITNKHIEILELIEQKLR